MLQLVRVFSWLPFWVLYGLARFIFFLSYYLVQYRKAVVYKNLQNSFPEKSPQEIRQIARRFYLNLADVMVEAVKAYRMSESEMQKRVKVLNPDVLASAIAQHSSAIVMTAHYCNWEWVLLGCAAHFPFSMNGIYKPLSNAQADQLMLRIRSRFDSQPVAMKMLMRFIVQQRDRPHAYGMVADQAPPRRDKKYWTHFLQQETAFFPGSEKLAKATQYPVLYVKMQRVKRGYYQISFQEIAQAPYEKEGFQITEKYVRLLEQHILEEPAYWLWSHNRWKYKQEDFENKDATLS